MKKYLKLIKNYGEFGILFKINRIYKFLYSIKSSILNLLRFFGFKAFSLIKKLEKSKNIEGGALQ